MSATSFFGQKHLELKRHAKGAGIALLNEGDCYIATMGCADLCRTTVGTLGMWKELDGPKVGQFRIPVVMMKQALTALSQHHSVALMERLVHPEGQFGPPYVAVWVVERTGEPMPAEPAPVKDFSHLLD
jgi:hypothetical protein